jgi:hypothetical protein
VAATVMGFSYIPSADSLAVPNALPSVSGGAYEIGPIAYEHGPAALDYTATIPMDLIYFVRRVAGVDTDAAVTAKLDALVIALQGCPTEWRVTAGIMSLDVTDARIGPAGFNQAIVESDSPWMACRVGIALQVAWGPYVPNPVPTATWLESRVGNVITSVASLTKNAYYPFASRTVTVKTSTDVVVSSVATWAANETTCSIVWTHNPIYSGYTVTIEVVYDGVTTTITRVYGGSLP